MQDKPTKYFWILNEVAGFRIRRVKQDSPLYMLGARPGEVFDVTRKGRPTQLKISVR